MTAPARTDAATASTELVAALRAAGLADVDDSPLSRSLYASDASLYRVAPQVVVRPRHTDEIIAALEVARTYAVPLTARGAGTSIAGNAVGPGIVLDTSRHLNRILEVDAADPASASAVVEPGVIQASLQRAAARHGLRFGPDPSTHNRATLGGMIGNNACGSRALGYGRTSDNVLGLDVVTGTGERLQVGDLGGLAGLAGHGPATADPPGASDGTPLLGELRALVAGELALIRTELGRFGRQVSGYSLEHLLPERGFDVARALVGTEGTLGLTLGARVRLVRDAPVRTLVVLGYPTMAQAADAVPGLLPHRPVACEGLDARIVDVVRGRRGRAAVPQLPEGRAWLMVELVGDHAGQVQADAIRVIGDAQAIDSAVVTDAVQAAALWRIREDGAGLIARTDAGDPAHAGWEDAAVPPERLGGYLREFETLLGEHGLTGVPYGHFGDGCIHVRIDFPLHRPDGRGMFRQFLTEAGRLVARHGGSMSGEHGDGRARGELLPLMYSPAVIDLFARVKQLFDPGDVLNPGIIVRPDPVDAAVRVAEAPPVRRAELPSLALAYRRDRGDVSMAVHRCTGVGKCRVEHTGTDQVMCPSYLATRNEKDTTRGRARVLQDVVAGRLGPDGWRSRALHDVLDLCLACKGCASDCPTGVDMASYKAEALHQRHRRRLRPRSHYALGWLPRWTRLVGRTPGLAAAANAGLRSARLHPVVTFLAGVDRRRSLPTFAPRTFRRWFAGDAPAGVGTEVVLFIDTFTDAFSPEVGQAAVQVLTDAGYLVRLTAKPVCCGLTWISTGQLDGARRQVRATVRELAGHVRAGRAVVGLEPSCLGVLRSDALELLEGADAEAAAEVAAASHTLAELLSTTPGWTPPDLSGVTGVAQPHCHHHAVMGWDTDAALLRQAGADIERVGGCCGLAGNFGVEQGHHDVSVAVAETQVLPAVRSAGPQDVVLADGFSCRTQLDFLAGHPGEHLAQLLARHRRTVQAPTRG